MQRLKAWAQDLRRDVMTLWFALKHPQTPWHARALAAVLTAYAMSPLDLIPDFIPVLGFLDDLLIIPAGVWLLLRLVPHDVLIDSRRQAQQWLQSHHNKPRSRVGLFMVLAIWCLVAWWLWGVVLN